jgi:hypothetical protein
VRHRGDREGRRRATVPRCYSTRDATVPRVLCTRVLFTPEGCKELAARVWGVVESPGSLREAGNN